MIGNQPRHSPRDMATADGWVNPDRRIVIAAGLMASALGVLATAASRANAADGKQAIKIVALGDSLTAGFQLPPLAAFPTQLEARLKAQGHAVEIANAGVSGDTTAAGLARLDWAVPDGTDAVIVELGANDALRGLPPSQARRNLDQILIRLKAKRADILLAGMSAPRNWGPEYVAEFDRIFPELAKQHDALLYPFFLDGVALRPDLNLKDGMHPNEAGVAAIVERILPSVEQLIARVKARRAAGG